MATKSKKSETKKSVEHYKYDAIVIGTGPGGEGAAMNLTKAGKRVRLLKSTQKSVAVVLTGVRFLQKHYVIQ